ncbi:MAG: FHA domain-containing protein [Bacteroidales bacterium]|jgi:hypothetical protein|nr:FHA domain-containing protein [Bacteroidales bacterium]
MANKLTNWLLGKPTVTTKETVIHDNPVDAKKELRNAIVAYFRNSFQTEKEITGTFVVWVRDSQARYQDYVRTDSFKNDLYTELDNRQLNAISKVKIEFKTENPPQEFEKITNGVYIQFLAKNKKIIENPKDVCTKAKITAVKGKGSLIKFEYVLDATVQTEFNIGRGEGGYNHIVIKENDLKNSEINNRVSRQHAKIIFVVGKGFSLQSRNETNRTIINRNNRRFDDLTDLNKQVLLQDNDEIELGKSVCLKFEMKPLTEG